MAPLRDASAGVEKLWETCGRQSLPPNWLLRFRNDVGSESLS